MLWLIWGRGVVWEGGGAGTMIVKPGFLTGTKKIKLIEVGVCTGVNDPRRELAMYRCES